MATRRWAADDWLASGPSLATVVERLATEPEPAVAGVLARHVASRAVVADSPLLLASPHARVRAAGAWLSRDGEAMVPLLHDRSSLVRSAARFRLTESGFDVRGWCERAWEQDGTVRALKAAVEAGVPIAPARLLDLAESGGPAGPTAIRALATPGLAPDEFARLVALLDRPTCAAAVAAVLSVRGGWRFDELAPRWADIPQRGLLAPLLASRGGWDRIRAALLAASDGGPALMASARRWVAGIGTAASTTLVEPDPAQRAHLCDLLARGGIAPTSPAPSRAGSGCDLPRTPPRPGRVPGVGRTPPCCWRWRERGASFGRASPHRWCSARSDSRWGNASRTTPSMTSSGACTRWGSWCHRAGTSLR
ncbi:hypothetical protein G7085_13900 [Tessaracoccus sp. HDW20]|uniref:hypothetical protein n=1 Tax=Tessaracoccus coleopterorum TaxID=2714950 RepID=UPI0018D4190B|nr:hypothetical protein [Tessaracoccus coleopterorum]NHB85342.1 hypothetical protein [Tessaracoccus coleopterorum]